MRGWGVPWLTVLTCPTRPQYLEATIGAIDAAGGADFFGKKLIVVDGPDLKVPELPGSLARALVGWEVVCLAPPTGSARCMVAILRAAAADDASFVLYFEDDVILTRSAIKAMVGTPVPHDCWALQFCDLRHMARSRGILKMDAAHHWGNQALKIPRSTIDRVAAAGLAGIVHDHPRGHASDVLLGRLAASADMPYLAIFAPSLVQHVGAESICNPGRDLSEYGRSAHNFPGVDFDALTLLGDE